MHVVVPTLNCAVDVQKWSKHDCSCLFETEVQQEHFLAVKTVGLKILCCELACKWPDHSQLAFTSPVKALDSLPSSKLDIGNTC